MFSVCAECGGKGKYTVVNAYDANDVEEVICEYCDGDGIVERDLTIAPKIKKQPKNGWYN